MIAKERLSGTAFMPIWVWHEHLARYEFSAPYAAGKTVVDCACGDGIGSETFSKAGAKRVEAFDLGADAVAAAGRRCGSPVLNFRTGDALKLDLPDSFADVYICLETIEHVEKDAELVREALRVLKADGVFICSTPNRTVTNPGKKISDKPWNQFHIREYSQTEFAALLGGAFGKIEWYGQNPQNAVKVGLMQFMGRLLPMHGAVRMNQFLKLPSLLLDKYEHHRVQPLAGRVCEYMVAVCSQPKK